MDNKEAEKEAKQRFLLQKMVNELDDHRARHTELVSVYVPIGFDLNKVINQLIQEQSTARNIKSATTRRNVMDALEKMIRELRVIGKTPPNGLALFSGNVSNKEGQSDVKVWSVEPPIPMKLRAYKCGQAFYLSPLEELGAEINSYGLLVLDRREANIAMLKGKAIVPIKSFKSMVPGKIKAGGQSAARFARVTENLAKDFFKKVGDAANTELTKIKNLKGVIIGGPGPTKENFARGNYLNSQIKEKIIGIVDIGYTGDFGLEELVEKSDEILEKEEVTKDVLDTWATSSLTPQLAIGLVKDGEMRKKLFPMDLRPQAHDIITFWLFNTVVKSELHTGKIPWKNTAISGHVQDEHGRKMSKSLGNVIEPQVILDKFGADALRYFAAAKKLGDDAPFKEKELVRAKKLMNKLWNTSRFVFMNLKSTPKNKPAKLEIEDKWILSRLASVHDTYIKNFKEYNTKGARHELEIFFLHEFCDFYLEMIKSRIYGYDEKSRYAAQWVTYNVLYSVLQMFAPILCHVTEELYQTLYRLDKKTDSIHLTEYEKLGKKDSEAEKLGELAKKLISELRNWKQKNGIKLGEQVEKVTIKHNDPAKVEKVSEAVARTMRISDLKVEKGKFGIPSERSSRGQ